MGYVTSLIFLGAGLVLVVLEMATLTFYLAALAFACLATALAAWLYPLEGWQATVVFAVAALIALPLAHLLRQRLQKSQPDQLTDMDKGGLVTVAADDNGVIKVTYRDSTWDAIWEGPARPKIGQRAEVTARDGARLRVKPVN